MINKMWSQQGWNLIFRRALNDWEVESFVTMLQILGAFGGCTDSTDRLEWKLNSKGAFLVKSVYWQLNQKRSCKGELALETSLESEYPYEGVILCLVGD